MTHNESHIGDKIKKFRTINNISQNDLANKINVSRQTISKWENNKNTPSFYYIEEICKKYKLNINSFIDGNSSINLYPITLKLILQIYAIIIGISSWIFPELVILNFINYITFKYFLKMSKLEMIIVNIFCIFYLITFIIYYKFYKELFIYHFS